ncbi:MAG TPA: hypothetical protein VI670_08290 [Thermoanaerobaculia bacterium]|jgi:hypothetical protein
MKRFAVFLLATALCAPAVAQGPAAEKARVDAIAKLGFLTGEWAGEGWAATGRDQRATFKQTESVRTAAGGSVLVIDGLGVNAEGKAVHQAFAVVSYDAAASKYRWRAYTRANGEVDVEPAVGDGTLVWGFPVPGGQVRFSIDRTPAGGWHEIGEFSRDGKSWFKTLEMNLERKR